MKKYFCFVATLILVIPVLLCAGCHVINGDIPKETYSDTTSDSTETIPSTQKEDSTNDSTSAQPEHTRPTDGAETNDNTKPTEAPTQVPSESEKPTEAPSQPQPETTGPTEQTTDPQESEIEEYTPDEDEGPGMPL